MASLILSEEEYNPISAVHCAQSMIVCTLSLRRSLLQPNNLVIDMFSVDLKGLVQLTDPVAVSSK